MGDIEYKKLTDAKSKIAELRNADEAQKSAGEVSGIIAVLPEGPSVYESRESVNRTD